MYDRLGSRRGVIVSVGRVEMLLQKTNNSTMRPSGCETVFKAGEDEGLGGGSLMGLSEALKFAIEEKLHHLFSCQTSDGE